MMTRGFSVGEAIKFGWNTLKSHIGFFVGVVVIAFVMTAIPSGIASGLEESSPFLSRVIYFISYIVGLGVNLGLIKVSLAFASNEKATYSDLFSQFPKTLNYFIAHILYSIIVTVGLILVIVPGIIWGVKYALYPYFIVEKDVGPLEALKLSGTTTQGFKWDLFALYFLSALIVLLGAFVIFIGLFVAIPTVMVAQAYAYKKLVGVQPVETKESPLN